MPGIQRLLNHRLEEERVEFVSLKDINDLPPNWGLSTHTRQADRHCLPGSNLAAIRDWMLASVVLGYDHVRIVDQVLGADPQFHPEAPELPFTHKNYIHEPF